MAVERCITCAADNQLELEAQGLEAMAGNISWREAGRRAGIAHVPLKNHMEKHYVDAVVAKADDELDSLIAVAILELAQNMLHAPAEVKPLYAAAIVNLRGLKETKPSQAHLISSLKTIQEMTGMRQEQRLMLTFAEAMFNKPNALVSTPARALEAPIDVAEIIPE